MRIRDMKREVIYPAERRVQEETLNIGDAAWIRSAAFRSHATRHFVTTYSDFDETASSDIVKAVRVELDEPAYAHVAAEQIEAITEIADAIQARYATAREIFGTSPDDYLKSSNDTVRAIVMERMAPITPTVEATSREADRGHRSPLQFVSRLLARASEPVLQPTPPPPLSEYLEELAQLAGRVMFNAAMHPFPYVLHVNFGEISRPFLSADAALRRFNAEVNRGGECLLYDGRDQIAFARFVGNDHYYSDWILLQAERDKVPLLRSEDSPETPVLPHHCLNYEQLGTMDIDAFVRRQNVGHFGYQQIFEAEATQIWVKNLRDAGITKMADLIGQEANRLDERIRKALVQYPVISSALPEGLMVHSGHLGEAIADRARCHFPYWITTLHAAYPAGSPQEAMAAFEAWVALDERVEVWGTEARTMVARSGHPEDPNLFCLEDNLLRSHVESAPAPLYRVGTFVFSSALRALEAWEERCIDTGLDGCISVVGTNEIVLSDYSADPDSADGELDIAPSYMARVQLEWRQEGHSGERALLDEPRALQGLLQVRDALQEHVKADLWRLHTAQLVEEQAFELRLATNDMVAYQVAADGAEIATRELRSSVGRLSEFRSEPSQNPVLTEAFRSYEQFESIAEQAARSVAMADDAGLEATPQDTAQLTMARSQMIELLEVYGPASDARWRRHCTQPSSPQPSPVRPSALSH